MPDKTRKKDTVAKPKAIKPKVEKKSAVPPALRIGGIYPAVRSSERQ
jgi:hypothetical protein